MTCDQCRFNLRSPKPESKLMQKSTRFPRASRRTNLFDRLHIHCSAEHRKNAEHVTISGSVGGANRSRAAQVWIKELVNSIVTGMF